MVILPLPLMGPSVPLSDQRTKGTAKTQRQYSAMVCTLPTRKVWICVAVTRAVIVPLRVTRDDAPKIPTESTNANIACRPILVVTVPRMETEAERSGGTERRREERKEARAEEKGIEKLFLPPSRRRPKTQTAPGLILPNPL